MKQSADEPLRSENVPKSKAADDRAVLTVAQVNAYIKQLIDSDKILASVYIKGEISNFTNHYKTGHFYFTLKDEDGVIAAVMFKSAASKLKFLPENGMKVIVHGRVSAFVRSGQYQIYVDNMEPDGVGALYIAFEQLKRKLEAEGLFSPQNKRPLPKIPTRIGIITSPTGAAIRDMINITKRRFPLAKLTLFPSLVQGDEAAKQLAVGVKYFNTMSNVDVIIIGRGGGSIEDLWAFNDENLARTIAASRIPVISAVGHEIDFTICDFAADVRAPTPSAAAELAVPDSLELKRKIHNIVGRMELSLTKKLNASRSELDSLAKSRALTSPQNFIDDKRMALLSLSSELESKMKLKLSNKRESFVSLTASLVALNPMSVISRGYSAVFSESGRLIKSVKQIKHGDKFTFRTVDGSVVGEAIDIMEDSAE
ncbi:MAG: exodeoxyribonuclease VII large subunit [Clostridiales bacterium]|nr:exodeoxyribonuclease VII large subunit [Clostridiales bacterium]